MKNKLKIMAGAAAALVSMGSVVQATPINGSIGFTGAYVQNGGTAGDLTTATSMSITSANIGTTTGSFVGATLISFATPILVNPATGLGTLWNVLVGGVTYTFTVTSESQNLTTPTALHLTGTGVITDGIAADTTTGTWQMGFGKSGESFQWQSTAAADASKVADGASSALLLGASLTGLGLVRKKIVAQAS